MEIIREGKSCKCPDYCEVGDWIAANSVPEWDLMKGSHRHGSGGERAPVMDFVLRPYAGGVRQMAWMRVS
jgi:hypothetical protein